MEGKERETLDFRMHLNLLRPEGISKKKTIFQQGMQREIGTMGVVSST